MTALQPNGQKRGWEYPPCPFCLTDVLTRPNGEATFDYACDGCGELFDRRRWSA